VSYLGISEAELYNLWLVAWSNPQPYVILWDGFTTMDWYTA